MNMDPTPVTKPSRMALEVTHQCQFNCRHCRSETHPKPDLDTTAWKKILSSLARYTQCAVVITGGEPMERPDIFELLTCAHNLGLQVVLATCGYLVNETNIAQLQEAGVASLSLSLDGASSETHDKIRQAPGGFDAVMKAAKLTRAAGLPFQINTTLSRINQAEVIAIAALTEQIGAACFNPFILVPAKNDMEIANQLLDSVEYEALLNELLTIKIRSPLEIRVTCGPQLARITRTRAEERVGAVTGCLGGREFGYITQQGDVQTCGSLEVPAGNLVANGYDFRHIWEESQLLQTVRDRKQISGKCSLCQYLDFCGGCRARAFLASGDYLGEDPLCCG